ncbi:PAS domain S-box-containing protein [Desulfuromusa kysingii]|uniref:histidine kinase n=1 Tax=Desulfuromusa kysingii TaxID=37625 RepID=A0A1H4BPC1_9BACT|nr:PAS domain S-box protein [Desulfuromusa kysingii]SEA49995.1 PAS domain S-box-containing protein [Desulfuromusa kysingii]
MIDITKLDQGGEYFLRLFNGIADAVFISECRADGLPGRYIEVNDVACALLDMGRDELLELSPDDIDRVAMEEKGAFKTIIQTIQETGKTLFKTHLLRPDGIWVPVEIGIQLFELGGQNVFFSVARDITLREDYEASIQALVRSTVGLTGQECLDEIVRNLCSWLNVDGACISLLQDDQLEIKASYCAGQQKQAYSLPVNFLPFREILNGKFCFYPENANSLFVNNDDEILQHVSGFIGCPMLGHDRQVLGMVCAHSLTPLQHVPHVEELLSIIASRAAAECERMRFVREISHSEEMLRTLFSSTAEAIVGINLEGIIEFCNPSAVKILGYDDEQDLIGNSFWQLIHSDFFDEQTPSTDVCPFISSITMGEKISSEDGFFTHRDGRLIPVEYWGHPMALDHQLVGGVITFIDISRRKTLEKQLQHSQRMEAIGTLTGGIAHDFNNILTVISGYVGLLESQITDNPKLLAKIQKIGEAAERGSKLTHGLLAYSRKKSEPSTPVDLNALILNIQDFIARVIGERIDKILFLSKHPLVALADYSQIEQVLVNLATNARDAMRDGGELKITTEQTQIDRSFCQMYGYGEPGTYALIRVEDNGDGIPREIQQKIFDPFFTTKDTGKGTGLGLAMVWGIVKQHKGYVLVDSLLGKGSEFKIYLPLTLQPVAPSPVNCHAQLPGGDETIMLVEDDPLVRDSTQSILTTVGYQVIVNDCAEAALQVLEKQREKISLILSDVVMPGIKGPEFYQEIRKKTQIPVIFMSGYTFDSLHEQGLFWDEVLLLNKPIQPIELLTRIREKLDMV